MKLQLVRWLEIEFFLWVLMPRLISMMLAMKKMKWITPDSSLHMPSTPSRFKKDKPWVSSQNTWLSNTVYKRCTEYRVSYYNFSFWYLVVSYFKNNRAGITVYGFMLDRTSLRTIFGIELSLVLWLLGKTIGISWRSDYLNGDQSIILSAINSRNSPSWGINCCLIPVCKVKMEKSVIEHVKRQFIHSMFLYILYHCFLV